MTQIIPSLDASWGPVRNLPTQLHEQATRDQNKVLLNVFPPPEAERGDGMDNAWLVVLTGTAMLTLVVLPTRRVVRPTRREGWKTQEVVEGRIGRRFE